MVERCPFMAFRGTLETLSRRGVWNFHPLATLRTNESEVLLDGGVTARSLIAHDI
jgi:hypothetical protein